jgi:tol-pal system protein YbgF
MSRRLLALAAASVLTLAVALPALAQVPMDDPLDARDARRVERMEKVVRELRSIVFQGRDTGKPVVVIPADTEMRVQEMADRITALEQTLTRLNGDLETANHNLMLSRQDTAAARAEARALSDRLGALELRVSQAAAAPTEDASAPVAEAPAAPTGPTAAESFSQARQLMLEGDYAASETAWKAYLARYPDGTKTPEARYWLGKTLASRAAWSDAATSYIGAIRGWPQTGWAPDAVVELSRSLIQLKKPADACQTLAEFARRYPKAAPAVQARATAARAQAKCAA